MPPRNVVSPLMEHLWLRENDTATGVQITEIKSSDNSSGSDDDQPTVFGHSWSYVNNERFREANDVEDIQKDDKFKNGFYVISNDEDISNSNNYRRENAFDKNFMMNDQMNCFTIIDRNCNLDSDTSSDEQPEKRRYRESFSENQWNINEDMDEVFTYDPTVDAEKRTIWIYSFKNRRLLTDNDYALTNIPSQDSSSVTSVDDLDELKVDMKANTRVGSPIPSAFMSKLNISAITPTLPTLTEITEPSKLSISNQTEKPSEVEDKPLERKAINGWITETTEKGNTVKLDKATDAYMSPRERRRRYRNRYTQCLLLGAVADINDHVGDKAENGEIVKPAQSSDAENQLEKSSLIDRILNDDQFVTAMNDTDIECGPKDQDRGDYAKKRLKKPQIRLDTKVVSKIAITEPIEKLDGDSWITDESLKENDRSQCQEMHGDCAGNRLLIRNTNLLKPAQWASYLPITESIPSLHLSLNTESDAPKVSWIRRLLRFFKCFK